MSKYYYNGVLLPEIPADVLAEYPYAWIGKHEKKGQYQLFLSKYQWWYDVNKDTIRCANDTNLMNTKVIWYTIDVSTADTATEWIFYSDTDKTFSLNSRPVFWSSHNIKKNSEDSTEIYFYGSEPVDSNEPEEPDVFYKVKGNRLTKIANAIREKTGKPYPMTLDQMPTEISNISGGGPLQSKTVYPSHEEQIITPDEDFYGLAVVKVEPVPRVPACFAETTYQLPNVVETKVNIEAAASVTEGKYYSHFLYNGVKLPRIPDNAQASYPYAWIRHNTTSGYYDLLLSSKPFYYGSSPGIYYESNKATSEPWYRVPISSAENATEWENNTSANTFSWWALDSARTVLWSNHDIPNGSADATEIYFTGSEPVPID